LRVIFRHDAQWVICEWCGAAAGPHELAPTLVFLIIGKEFLRKHRFCEPPNLTWPPEHRPELGETHAFPRHHRAPWEPEREPGE
jgi:hypothetical protein